MTGPVNDLLRWLFTEAAAGQIGHPTSWGGSADDELQLGRALERHRGWTLLARRRHLVDGLPEKVAKEAVMARRRAAGHQLAVETDLTTCGSALDGAGIAWVCVKGPVLDSVYRRTGDSRASLDLDLLVAPGDFVAALRVLGRARVALLDRNWELLRRVTPGEVALRAPLGTVVDLHWSLVSKEFRRRRTGLVVEDLLAAALPVDVGGRPVPSLDPASALAHLCLHAAGSGGHRLYWLLDVARSASDPRLDWCALVAVAAAWRVTVAVGLVLDRSRRTLGAPVPRWVVRQLLGRRGWATVDRLAGTVAASPGDGRTRWLRLVCSGALEHDSPAAWVLARGVRSRDLTKPRRPFVQSPENPGSALYPSGTEADLFAYFDAVASESAR